MAWGHRRDTVRFWVKLERLPVDGLSVDLQVGQYVRRDDAMVVRAYAGLDQRAAEKFGQRPARQSPPFVAKHL
jgi:hypothetical protein